jgi:hypothetical protein
MKNRYVAFVGWLVLLLLAAVQASASAAVVLYVHDDSNNLATVDLGTGAVNIIGNFGLNPALEPITDIAFDPSGNLYGVSFKTDASGSTLYRIDATTAALTSIGPLGLIAENALVFGADGTLYTAGLFGTTLSAMDTTLYTVNTSTGAATPLGNIGYSSAGDLAFNGGGLYLSSTTHELIRINLAGAVSGEAVGPFGVAFTDVFGLATGDDGVLYGVAGTKVFSTNTSTGAGTLVLDYTGNGLGPAFGTAFFTEAGASPVPEPGSLTLMTLGVIGLFASRWRRLVDPPAESDPLLTAAF